MIYVEYKATVTKIVTLDEFTEKFNTDYLKFMEYCLDELSKSGYSASLESVAISNDWLKKYKKEELK